MTHRVLMATLAISLFHFPCGYADTAAPQQKTSPEASCGGVNPEVLTIQSFEQLMVDWPAGPRRASQTPAVTLQQFVILNGPSIREQPLSFSQRLPKGAVLATTGDQRITSQDSSSVSSQGAGNLINFSFPVVRDAEQKQSVAAAAVAATGTVAQHSCGGGCCGEENEASTTSASSKSKTNAQTTKPGNVKATSVGGGCGSGGGSGCGCGGGAHTSAAQRTIDPTRIVYQARLPKEYAPDRWATVSVEASPNRLLLNQKNLVTLTAYLKVKEGQAQGCTFFLPKLEGAEITVRLTTPGVTVRQVPQGAIFQYASSEPQQKVQLLMEVVPHHASSLDLSRVFMCWVALAEALFPLQANDSNAPTIQSRSMVSYTSSVSIPITRGGRK